MLPAHIATSCLDALIRDYVELTEPNSNEYTPLETLVGYFPDSEYGGMPFENPESDETDPMKRLSAGERLAIQLHMGELDSDCDFIDGKKYRASTTETQAAEKSTDLAARFPSETGFFALGVWLGGDRLRLEQMQVDGDFNGNLCIGKAVFPQSMLERLAAYVKRVSQ